MKKRLLLLTLAIVMAFAMAIPALATEEDGYMGIGATSFSIPITGGNQVNYMTITGSAANGVYSGSLAIAWQNNNNSTGTLSASIAIVFGTHSAIVNNQSTVSFTVNQTCTEQKLTFSYTRPSGQAGGTSNEVIIPAYHVAGEAATCETAQTCINCDFVFEAALNHDMSEALTADATCTADGFDGYSECSRCAYTVGTIIGALGHERVVTIIPATCTVDGVHTAKCERCDISLPTFATPPKATGHNWSVLAIAYKAPTCTEDGFNKYSCTNGCGEFNEVVIEKLGHDRVVTIIPATCTVDGVYTAQCGRCGINLPVFSTPPKALGHDYIVETIGFTCTEPGSVITTCNRCDYYDVEIVPNGHIRSEAYDKLYPTCTENGYFRRDCVNCDELAVDKVLPALDHYIKKVADSSATCETDGVELFVCTRDGCGYWYYGEIRPATGHSLEKVEDRAATCEADGAEFFACFNEGCGHWEYGEIYQALGHVFEYTMREDGQWFKNCTREDCNYWDYADAPKVTNAVENANSIKIVETAKNIWTVTFTVTETLSNGVVRTVNHEILIGKNSDGKINLGDYTLTYDIKGNGSNIKAFGIVMN